MKRDVLCMKRLKQLLGKARKAGGRADFYETDDIVEFLLWSILTTYASESRSVTAISKLQAAMVDYNELRVSPVAEIVEVIGNDFPFCRPAAEEISRTLLAIFNRLHHLNLDFLKTSPRRTAELFLNSLDGIGAHAKAMMIMRRLKGHAVPLDAGMYALLQKTGSIPAGMSSEAAQKWLAPRIKERDVQAFYGCMKRYAAVHAPRKLLLGMQSAPKPAPMPAGVGAQPPAAPPAKTETARKEPTPKTRKPATPPKAAEHRKKTTAGGDGKSPVRKSPRKTGSKPR